jgi:pyruvate/2-oxoglutarate dehydrogenase complex dihydrolipoamide acyltransferase (E2) component
MTELKIPAAGDAVAEVQLVEWVAKDGAVIVEGEVIYTIESDKSVIDVEAPASGKLSINVPAGEVYAIGHIVGTID